MAVRDLAGRLIFSVPVVGRVARYTTGQSGDEALRLSRKQGGRGRDAYGGGDYEVVDEEDVAVVEPDSPRQRIHKQLLKNRNERCEALIDDDDVTLVTEALGIDGVKEQRVEEYLSDQHQPGIVSYLVSLSANRILRRPASVAADVPRVSAAKRLLDTDCKMDLFLDSLDNETKEKLLEELISDLNRDVNQHGSNNHIPKKHSSEEIGIDKIQEVIIMMIKFGIVMWKLLMPLFRFFYKRYTDNSLYIVNQRNTAMVFEFMLNVMRIVEGHLSQNEEVITHIYNQGRGGSEDREMEMLYRDISQEASRYLSQTNIRQLMMEFILGKVYVLKPEPSRATRDTRTGGGVGVGAL